MTRRFMTALGLGLALAGLAAAQDDADDEDLRQRLRELEAKVERLEAERGGDPPPPEAPPPDDGPDPLAPPGDGPTPGDGPAPGAPGRDAPAAPEPPPAEAPAEDFLQLELPFSVKLKLSGQLRLRGEVREHADYRVPGTFGRPAGDDADEGTDFVLQRVRLRFDLTVVEDVLDVRVELQDSRTWGDALLTADTAELHLRQGYARVRLHDVAGVPLAARGGRYRVRPLGDQRLISPLEFSNVSRQWDGFELVFDPEGWWITAFAQNVREGRVFSADGDENDDFWFTGLYVSNRMVPGHELDAYLFWRHLSDRIFPSEPNAFGLTRLGDRKDFTAGARVKGEVGPLGYSGEAAYQWGDQAGDAIQAWAGAAKAWVKVDVDEGTWFQVAAEYAFASGDPDPDDGRIETFDPLLPFGHFYHGHMDLIGWLNLHTANVQLTLSPLADLTLHADGHAFWVDQRTDAWYSPGKAPIRLAGGGNGSYIGAELDLYVKYRLWERVAFWGGYSHFWTGEFVRDTGRSADQDWVHLQVAVDF